MGCSCNCGGNTNIFRGPKGNDGAAATIRIGSVTMGLTPSVRNVGTPTDAVLDFVLPAGSADTIQYKQSATVSSSSVSLHLNFSDDGGTTWHSDFATGAVTLVAGSGLELVDDGMVGNNRKLTLNVDPSAIEGVVASVNDIGPDTHGNVKLPVKELTDDIDSETGVADRIAATPRYVHEFFKARHYVFNQTTPSDTWVINHNFGYYPQVTLVDDSGNVFLGEVRYDSVNKLTISFSMPRSGKACLL